MDRGDFTANEASVSGGGAYLLGGCVTLRAVRFEDNLSPAAWSVHGEHSLVQVQGGQVQGTVESNFAGTVAVDGSSFVEGADCDADGVPDRIAIVRGWVKDCDGNGKPDTCDIDCNGNGIVDACEIAGGLAMDVDGDGQIDSCQARQAEALAVALVQAAHTQTLDH
jgi:hypothetical protein